jgi:ECF transporter S component (folate family)
VLPKWGVVWQTKDFSTIERPHPLLHIGGSKIKPPLCSDDVQKGGIFMSKNKSTTLYPHPFSKAYWRDAVAELKDLRILIFAALMIALRVLMKQVAIPIAMDLKINTAFFVNAFGAMVFGPVVAALAAGVTDVLGYLIRPEGVYFIPLMLTEIAGSVIFAMLFYRAKVSTTRVIISRFAIDFGVNILLSGPLMLWYYAVTMGKSYVIFDMPRIIKNLAMFPVESILLTLFLSAMVPIAYRLKLVYDKGENLRFKKKQIALLASLVVVGIATVCLYFNTANHVSSLSNEKRAALNRSITAYGQEQGALAEDEVVILNKVYKKLFGDTTIEFKVYQVTEETDLEAAASYTNSKAQKDETMTEGTSGSVVLVKDDMGDMASISLKSKGN